MNDFYSDNVLPASPEILDAMLRVNDDAMRSYGGDEVTARVKTRCRELFETEVDVFPVVSGIAGNALSIAAATPGDGAVLCHAEAHIALEELGAATFFSGGAKLVPIEGENGKLTADGVAKAIAATPNATCLSITNVTEAGTLYTANELQALCDVAKRAKLRVHLDGARFANAIAASGASAAEMSWRAGVDILSFGATKNGAACADLVVVFNKELDVTPHWHRSGHRPSKMRFLSAQLEAYLANDLWLRNARHANAMAARLAEGIRDVVEVVRPVEANIVFARLPRIPVGFRVGEWFLFGPDVYRMVCGFATRAEDVDGLIAAINGGRASARRPG